MKDPRFTWGTKYVQIKQDPVAKTKQKIGLLNKLGWAGYYLDGELFLKKYPYYPDGKYVDYGCNTESYTDADMLELETLGPLSKLMPGNKIEYTEQWYLYKVTVTEDENSIDTQILPLVK
jgi:hypothetical protein